MVKSTENVGYVTAELTERERYLRKRAAENEKLNIRLTNNYAFKKVFRNEEVLKGFLMAVLNLKESEIRKLEIMDPHELGEDGKEKEGILDIKVHMDGRRKINIEMQNTCQEDWAERSIFYLCRMYVAGFQRGGSYGDMEQCVHIGVLDFTQMKTPGFYHKISLLEEKTKEKYSDKLAFHVLQLNQLKDASEEEKTSELYHWARLIAARNWEEVSMEAHGNVYREAAMREMEQINKSENERYLYLREEMAESDRASQLNTARKQGLKEGRQQGQDEHLQRQVARKLEKGISAEAIADALEEELEKVCEIISKITEEKKDK